MNSFYRDCRDCLYGQRVKFTERMCNVSAIPVPIEYMRRPESDCGVEAVMFEPVDTRQYPVRGE